MSKQPTVILTGGGTAGHVMPHLALLPKMRSRGWSLIYLGSEGIEKELAAGAGLEFRSIATGKLRRYLSWRNLTDVFKVGLGICQAFVLLFKLKPDAVFSKGGFVSVPVAIAARALGIPVISHESDVTPGLANRIIARFAARILYSFPETGTYLPKTRSQWVGVPVRDELKQGEPKRGLTLCGFDQAETLPTLLIMGGSLGAQRLNEAIAAILPQLVRHFRLIHLTGKGKSLGFQHPRYKAFEFVGAELKDLLALADFCISRAGGNAIFELLSLNKPMLLVPLEAGSRGDQVLNARSFERNGWALVQRETDLNPASLMKAIERLQREAPNLIGAQKSALQTPSSEAILDVIAEELT